MTTSTSIPRFLLPQLTWKTTLPRAFALALQSRPPTTSSKARLGKPHQTLTSIAQPWHESSNRPSPWIQVIQRSRARPSLRTTRKSNPLSAVFRIVSQKPFSTTAFLFRDHHFDTLKFVQRLKDEGFSEEQSKAMMLVLSDVIEESIQNLTRTMVLREGRTYPFF